MPTTPTALLGLALPVQGELDGQWGNVVNNQTTSYLDIAIAGTQTLSTDADANLVQTLGTNAATNIGATTAQYAVIRWTASNGGNTRNINVPNLSKTYVVINDGTGSIVLRGTTGPTAGITIVSGEKCVAAWNGSDFVKVSSSVADGVTTFQTSLSGLTPSTATSGAVTLAGTLGVANGGTGLTSGTSGGVPYYSAAGTIASSGALTANNVLVGGGAGATPASTNLLAIAAAVTVGNYIQAIGYADTVTALGNTGTAINLDVTSGGVFTATLNGNATITLRYPVATGASSFILILTNDATAGRTVAFAGGTFRYPNGSVTRTTTANAVDIWFFFTPNAGTTYYASIPMANLS